MPTFEDVVSCIRGERAYQETRWKRPAHIHSLTEYLVYIDHYVKNAMAIVSKEDGEKGALADFRKIAALAFAAMEENGLEHRKDAFSDYKNLSQEAVDAGFNKMIDYVAEGTTNRINREFINGELRTPPPTDCIPWPGLKVNWEPNTTFPEGVVTHTLITPEPDAIIPKLPDSVFDPTPPCIIEPRLESRIEDDSITYGLLEQLKGMTKQVEDMITVVKKMQDISDQIIGPQPKFDTEKYVKSVEESWKDSAIMGLEKNNPHEWVSYRFRYNLLGEYLGVDTFKQTTRALAKTPSPRYVIHKCCLCEAYLFFYDDGISTLPDTVADHFLNEHPTFCRAVLNGWVPLETQLTELVKEF